MFGTKQRAMEGRNGCRKSQICVGQALNSVSTSDHFTKTKLTNVAKMNTQTQVWEIIYSMISGVEPDGVQTVYPMGFTYFTMGDLGICMYSTGTDKVVWFYNPNGIIEDFESSTRDYEKFENKFQNREWYRMIMHADASELHSRPEFPDERFTEKEEMVYQIKRIEHMRYNSHREDMGNELVSWTLTKKPPATQVPNIPHHHIATAIFTASQLARNRNIHVLHPYHSMSARVANHNRALASKIARHIRPSSFWLHVYFQYAEISFKDTTMFGPIVRKSDFMHIVKDLRINVSTGLDDRNAQMGAAMYYFAHDLPMRDILEEVYDLIPNLEELGLQPRLARNRLYSSYHRNLNNAFNMLRGKSSHLNMVRKFFEKLTDGSRYASYLRVDEIMHRWQYEFFNPEREDAGDGNRYRRLHTPSYVVDMIMILVSCKHEKYFERLRSQHQHLEQPSGWKHIDNATNAFGAKRFFPNRRNRWLL